MEPGTLPHHYNISGWTTPDGKGIPMMIRGATKEEADRLAAEAEAAEKAAAKAKADKASAAAASPRGA